MLNKIFSHLIIASLTAVLVFGVMQCKNSKSNFRQLEQSMEQRDKILNEKINELNQQVTTATTKVFTYDKKLSKLDDRYSLLDQRLRINGDRLKELQSSVSFTRQAIVKQGETEQPIFPEVIIAEITDTFDLNSAEKFVGTTWQYDDPFISISSTLKKDLGLAHNYTIRESNYDIDILRKGKGLFRESQFIARISVDNPSMRVSDTEVFLKRIPKPTWSLSFGVGYSAGYFDNIFQHGPTMSLIVGRNLLHLKYK